MKIKIEDLKKEYNAKIKGKKERAEKIASVERHISELNEEAKAYAIRDDLDSFRKIKQEVEFQNYQLEALKTKQENEAVITIDPDKVYHAWVEYEKERAKTVKRLEEDLAFIKQKLFDVLKEATDIQTEGLNIRNECAKYMGLKPALNGDEKALKEISDMLPMDYFDFGYNTGGYPRFYEFEYLEDIGKLPSDVNQRMHRTTLFKGHFPAPVIFDK